MAEIILFPTHKDYCNECIYHNPNFGTCKNIAYNENSYKVNCVWKYCKFKKRKKQRRDIDGNNNI